jgi:hypothetical protein
MSDDIVPTTSWSANKQHYANLREMRPSGHNAPGLVGRSLCTSECMPTDVYDQVAFDDQARRYDLKQVTITDLPECKRCRRAVDNRQQTES